jgi:hypothetical protein
MTAKFIKQTNEAGQVFFVNEKHDEIIQAAEEFKAYKDANPSEYPILDISQEEMDAHDASEYQRARRYPSIADQLDMIFHAGLGGDEFQATIQAVKDSHPKP